MSWTRSAVLALCAALVSTPGLVAEESGGVLIVDRSIARHGGPVFDRSSTELELCSGSGCYELSVRIEDGLYRYRVAGAVSAGHREVIATNDTLRHWHEGERQSIDPAKAQSLRDWAMARIYFVFLPYRLKDPGVRHRDLGIEAWDGRDLHKVKVTFRASSSTDHQDEYLFWFDPESARLEQFAYSFEGNPGGLRFRRLSNYREVGGILFYDQENLGVDGDDLEIDLVDPKFVKQQMRPISTVTVHHIQVEPLSDAAAGV